jgi:glycerophosphoryl diester phosphodiesterase
MPGWGRQPSPLIIAHRGASRVAPENTLLAFRRARELGADGIELDVMRCKTGEVVVFHDDDLRRMAGRRERIAQLSLRALRKIDLGAGQVVPTLEEVLGELGSQMLLNVELKIERVFDDGLVTATCAILARAELGSRLIISSFNPLALARCRQLAPSLPRGLLFSHDGSLPLRRAWAAGFVRPLALHPESALVDAAHLAAWWKRGYAVNVWTVDDPRELLALAALGVDGIITNEPDRTRSILAAGLARPASESRSPRSTPMP